jgi:hypothetical protein
MTKLTEAQQGLLTSAAHADGCAIDADKDHKPTAQSLIKRGLMIAIPQTDGPSRLMITEAGRVAIGEPTTPCALPEPPASPAPVPDQPVAARAPKGKIAFVVALLRQPDGATVEAMMEATGWQAHSVRGAMSGAIKKGLGLNVASTKTEAGRIYRIVAEAEA